MKKTGIVLKVIIARGNSASKTIREDPLWPFLRTQRSIYTEQRVPLLNCYWWMECQVISELEVEFIASRREMRGRVPVWLRPQGGAQAPVYRGVAALKGKASKQADAREYHRVVLHSTRHTRDVLADASTWPPLQEQEQ